LNDDTAFLSERWDQLVRMNEALGWRAMRMAQLLMNDGFLHALLRASPERRLEMVYDFTGGFVGDRQPNLLAWMRDPASWMVQ
jgi:hypothetical protein